MNKQESTFMKGVAILLMIWLHCFNTGIPLVRNFYDIDLNGSGLCSLLAERCAGPVELYMVLSGYGLYYTYRNKHAISPIRRILKLLIHYWLVMAIFVGFGFLLRSDLYPGSWIDLINNITTWNTSYNSTTWFVFPYIINLLLAAILFRFLDSHPRMTIIFLFIEYVLFYGCSWAYHHNLIELPFWVKNIIQVCNFFFPICCGAVLCKYDIITKMKLFFEGRQIIVVFFLFCCFFLRSLTSFHFFVHLIYSISLIILLCSLNRGKIINRTLEEIGKLSTSMWFIHAFFIWYLFPDFMYGLNYPIFIFFVALFFTFTTALIIDFLNKKIQITIGLA